jgi:hypothetical protein
MPRAAACPACGAALRPGSPWCTLCYADLRPPEERPVQPAAAPAAPAPTPVGDPLTQPLIDFLPGAVPLPSAPVDPILAPAAPAVPAASALHAPLEPPGAEATWPCTTCGTRNPLASDRCAACQAPFLSKVAAEGRQAMVLPVVGDLTRLSRSQRLIGAFGVVLVLVVFVALVTLLLSKRPTEGGGTSNTPTTAPNPIVVPETLPPDFGATSAPSVAPTSAPSQATSGGFPSGFPSGVPGGTGGTTP